MVTEQGRETYRSEQFCSRLARRAAGNFYYGFMLLPRDQKRAMCALYAFMRHSDDIVDDNGSASEKRDRLATWRRALDRALDDPEFNAYEASPILPAFIQTVRRYQIPRRYLHDTLDGVAMDLEPASFATFQELYPYCYRVASTVGLCCLHIWGFDGSDEARHMAEACGVAFQLTNIVRDVAEDARRGRIYLPAEDLERFRVSSGDLIRPLLDDPKRALLAFECQRADSYYEQALGLEQHVARAGRPMLRAMVGIYRGLLAAIRGARFDVFKRRVALSPLRKISIAARALLGVQ